MKTQTSMVLLGALVAAACTSTPNDLQDDDLVVVGVVEEVHESTSTGVLQVLLRDIDPVPATNAGSDKLWVGVYPSTVILVRRPGMIVWPGGRDDVKPGSKMKVWYTDIEFRSLPLLVIATRVELEPPDDEGGI